MSGHVSGRIVRHALEHEKYYSIISNAWLRDARLSFKARGVLAQLLSYSNGFNVSVKQLTASTIKEGRDAILAALKELQAYGYLAIERERLSNGRFQPVWHLMSPAEPLPLPVDNSESDNPTRTQKRPTGSDLPHSPGTGNPTVKKELSLEVTNDGPGSNVTTRGPVENFTAPDWWHGTCPVTRDTHRRRKDGLCADCEGSPTTDSPFISADDAPNRKEGAA